MRAEPSSKGRLLRAVSLAILLAASPLPPAAAASEAPSLEILPPAAPEPLAEPAEPQEPAAPPLVGPDLETEYATEPYGAADLTDGSVIIEDGPIVSLTDDPSIEQAADAVPPNDLFYYPAVSSTNWIIGHDDRFGMVNLESSMSLRAEETDGMVGGFDFHFLDGPVQTEMPPRLFDAVIGYGRRRWVSDNVGYDVVARVGAYTDFEGSVRKGIRFPGHAVAQVRMTPTSDWLLGVELLDRDDVSLLPVIGPRWRPTSDWELELVFPRPKIAVRLPSEDHWAYLRGELGGGTWAIERNNSIDDNATYRDVRIAFGYQVRGGDLNGSVEIAYLFARDLSYRSGIGDMALTDAMMIALAGGY